MSDNIAFLFPGQGSQSVGMGASLIETSLAARRRLEEANDALGFDIGKLILEGPEDELRLTANTQPAILLISVIAFEALLGKRIITPVASAGHSLGEFSACWAAGAVGFYDVIKLVRKRGELMQSAVPVGEGAMAAVIGLSAENVAKACAEVAGFVAPANFNSPEQTVIAGKAEDVEKAIEIVKQNGAKKVVLLQVSAPFHTKLMAPAREGLAEYMKTIEFHDPKYPVLRNVDAGVSKTAEEIKDGLIRQVTGCVNWVGSMKMLAEMGTTKAFEIGPGKALAGLMRRINKSIPVLPVGSIEQVDLAVEGLNGQL